MGDSPTVLKEGLEAVCPACWRRVCPAAAKPRVHPTAAKAAPSPAHVKASGTPQRVTDWTDRTDLRPQPHTTNRIHRVKIMKHKKSPVSTMVSRALSFSNRNGKRRAEKGSRDTDRWCSGEEARLHQHNSWTPPGHLSAAVMSQPLPPGSLNRTTPGFAKCPFL